MVQEVESEWGIRQETVRRTGSGCKEVKHSFLSGKKRKAAGGEESKKQKLSNDLRLEKEHENLNEHVYEHKNVKDQSDVNESQNTDTTEGTEAEVLEKCHVALLRFDDQILCTCYITAITSRNGKSFI